MVQISFGASHCFVTAVAQVFFFCKKERQQRKGSSRSWRRRRRRLGRRLGRPPQRSVTSTSRLPIFHGGAPSGCSVQDEISADAGWRRPGVPASSVAGQDSCGGAAGECSAESAPAESGKSAIKPDPKEAGWIRRVRVGANPIERTPCPRRMGALEKTVRGFADRGGDVVVKPEQGTTFDSLTEAYNFYNLYSWEYGFEIRYGKSCLNPDKRKTMQEVVCRCSVNVTKLGCPLLVIFFRSTKKT